MKENLKVDEVLITKYIAGECSAEEREAVEKWRGQSSENEGRFMAMYETWLLSGDVSSLEISGQKRVWQKLSGNMELEYKERRRKAGGSLSSIRAAVIAAVVSIAATSSFFLLTRNDEPKTAVAAGNVTVIAPLGQKSETMLPDSTYVWLNSGATLTYSTSFGQGGREVRLEGEAFFDVRHSGDSQFRVNTGEICVRVYGTKFNVKAFAEDKFCDVSLLEGRVDIIAADGRLLGELAPDRKFVYDRRAGEGRTLACDAELESIWRYGKLKIEWETIESVIEKMERWYGVTIDMEVASNSRLYWLTIKTESLNEMLQLIDKITPIEYSINGEEVCIRYKK